MIISKEGVEITKRFFQAIDMLKAQKQIRGLQTFTKQYGLNRWNLNMVKWEPEQRVLKPELIAYLCKDYGVSPEWILFGKGGMFK